MNSEATPCLKFNISCCNYAPKNHLCILEAKNITIIAKQLYSILKQHLFNLKNRLALCLILLCRIIPAQQPAYFILGQEQFKGVQIYDVIQDNNLNYWFATNEGLYVYNYYKYEKIECEENKSSSVFGFVKNKAGTIFCHNLNNQIFQINDKKCSLYYELSSEEGRPDILLAIGNDDNLIIGATKIRVINKQGVSINQFDPHKKYISYSFITKNNQLLFYLMGSDSLVIYSKGKFSRQNLNSSDDLKNKTDVVLDFFRLNKKAYALDKKNKECYLFDEDNFNLIKIQKNELFNRSPSVKLYKTGNELWVGSTLQGIVFFNKEISPTNGILQYHDYFISNIYKDEEGNYLLSTFDHGVIVIPDLNVPDVINPFKEDPITSIISDEQLGLILGSSKGKVLNYQNNKYKELNKDGKRPINTIRSDKKSDLLVYDDGSISFYNKLTQQVSQYNIGSLKDVIFIGNNKFYLGTNAGIIKCNREGYSNFKTKILPDLQVRVYALAYNPLSKLLYATTANGLYVIDSLEKSTLIIHHNKPIFPNAIYYHDNKTYISIKKKGIFIIKDDKITDSISLHVDHKKFQIDKFILYNNTILLKTTNRLFQFDMHGQFLKSIHSLFGFSNNRVIDFTIHQNQLWVSHSGGVQKINLNYLRKQKIKPEIRINQITVNERSVNSTIAGDFSNDERKLQIELSTPTLLNHELIHYYYKLDGYDKHWNINDFQSNLIAYNALAPGNYTFIARMESQGVFSPMISYSFSIAYPYYAQWWFISLCIFSFVLFVWIIYRYQLNIQRKKSEQLNELNSSKLTAIQSQMNPHFIFNSLNSIQDLVLKGDVEKSYSYITTFSNLVRRTLSYSEKDFIDFEQEIKLLEIYLSLEKLRFKKDFNYSLEYQNIDDIMLPPLLIQPFIENSLIHGLLHKEGAKRITIKFIVIEDVLKCIIEDNGVGRERSKAIKLRQKSEHESFSGKAIHNRFEILSNVFKGQYGYYYEDLYSESQPSGTKVTLTIPIKHKF